jgi:selenium metabolism protein YedF
MKGERIIYHKAMEQKTIDLRGLRCPEPLKKTQEELDAVKEGTVTVLVNSPSNWNIQRYATKRGMSLEMKKHNDHFEMRITKTPYDRPREGLLGRLMKAIKQKAVEEEAAEEKSILLIVGSDTMGKVEDIGRVLMKGFFETMRVTGEIPHTIFFLNAGVRLTTLDAEIIPILKDIESMGVEIYSCGTCLKHFNLESALAVGYRGTTNHIVEGIKDFKKVIWI